MVRGPTILAVEQEAEDILLLRRAFAKSKVLNPLQVVQSAEEAIRYLNGQGEYANRDEFPTPSLVLLGLARSHPDGLGILYWIRQQPGLNGVRVIVTTRSKNLEDINRASELGAEACLLKPLDFDRLCEFCQALGGHWIWLDKLPEGLAGRHLLVGRAPE